MPNLTVSGNVDTMLGAADNAAIRSAIGVGQTDAPTFLAQTLTGQSLTGTQATSLVDLAATWNTSGTPTAIKLNVVETGINSNAASNLLDLQVGGVSRFRVTKGGELTMGLLADPITYISSPYLGFLFHGGGARSFFLGQDGSGNGLANMSQLGSIGFSSSNVPTFNTSDVRLWRDAAGILAQRNGTAKQTLRIYNTYTSASIYERAVMDWNGPTPGNLQIGTEFLGSGSGMAARPIDFVTGGVARWQISAAGHFLATTNNTYDIGAAGGVNSPRSIHVVNCYPSNIELQNANANYGWTGRGGIYAPSSGVVRLSDLSNTDFNRLQLGSTADTHPAIARDGAGIKFTGAAAGLTSWIKVPAVAVSALPAAATAGVGARAFVNDALAPTFGSAVTGGAAVTVPVYSTGSAWNVG